MNRFRFGDYWSALAVACAACCLSVGCGSPPIGTVLKYEIDPSQPQLGLIDTDALVAVLNGRLGRIGRARAVDDEQIEIDIYGDVNPARLASIKERICGSGDLNFRITADLSHAEDRPIIEAAKLLVPNKKKVEVDGKLVGEWVAYAPAEFGPIDAEDDRVVKRLAGDVPEALVLIDTLNVTGEYLTSVTKGIDSRGGPAINFSLDPKGSAMFRLLTSQNKPNLATGAVRYLGILFNSRLISAPSIRETISGHGQISGGAMTEDEVENVIAVLNAGRLPRPIREVVAK